MLTLQQTEQPITALDLRPEQRQRLDAALETYAMLKADADLLTEQMEIEKSKIGKVLADYGADKVETDAFYLSWMRDVPNNRLDKKKLIAMGVTTQMLEDATSKKKKKAFFQIRGKKDKPKYEEPEE